MIQQIIINSCIIVYRNVPPSQFVLSLPYKILSFFSHYYIKLKYLTKSLNHCVCIVYLQFPPFMVLVIQKQVKPHPYCHELILQKLIVTN